MKKTAFVLILLFVISNGCEKKEAQSVPEFVNTMDFVGEAHNEALGYILKNYKSDYGAKSLKDTLNQVVLLLNDFIKTIPEESIFNGKVDAEIISKKLLDGNKLKSINLPEREKLYVDRLKKLLRDQENDNYIDLFKKVSKLEREVWQSDLPENEKYTILTATAVGKYSWKLWTEYIPETKGVNLKPTLRQVVAEADVEAAVVGMIGGCIIGGIVGTAVMPGVGSLTGCIVESVVVGFQAAAIGSTVAAIKYLLF